MRKVLVVDKHGKVIEATYFGWYLSWITVWLSGAVIGFIIGCAV